MIRMIPYSALLILTLFLPFSCDSSAQCPAPTEQRPLIQEFKRHSTPTYRTPDYIYDPNTKTCAALLSGSRVAFTVDCNNLPKELKTYFGIVEK